MSKRLISLIIPAYNEEDCVDELATRLSKVFDSEPQYDFEAIIVFKEGIMDLSLWLRTRIDYFKTIANDDGLLTFISKNK
jgi:dolichol-phosphate mannosyltransferase